MQLQKEKGWGEDKMALSVSQSNMKNQSKGSSPRRTTMFKGRCSHCSKWGHKKAKCREWLRLTHDEQEKVHKKSTENIQCYNCHKMGHIARDCPEKKVSDSSGGQSGGFAMMCIEVTNPQELMTLQDWINQSHKNEIQLEQTYVTEIRCQNDQSRKEDPHLKE